MNVFERQLVSWGPLTHNMFSVLLFTPAKAKMTVNVLCKAPFVVPNAIVAIMIATIVCVSEAMFPFMSQFATRMHQIFHVKITLSISLFL